MNLKKISALAISSIMLFSTIANAATTKSGASALTPTWNITVTQLNSQQEVRDASKKAFSDTYNATLYDYYKLTYTLTNLGNLSNDMDSNVLGIYAITLGLRTTSIVGGAAKAFSQTKMNAGQDGTVGHTDYYNMTMEANGGVTNPYPAYDEENEEPLQTYSGSLVFSLAVAINKGTSVTVNDFYSLITYVTDEGTVDNFNTVAPTSIIIGESDPELELTVTGAGAAGAAQFPNGYIWTANVTKGTASVTAFDIVFEAGAESLPKSINNLEVLNGWLGSGSAEFQIGLKTTKTLTGATFTVTDDDSASDAVDWVPSV